MSSLRSCLPSSLEPPVPRVFIQKNLCLTHFFSCYLFLLINLSPVYALSSFCGWQNIGIRMASPSLFIILHEEMALSSCTREIHFLFPLKLLDAHWALPSSLFPSYFLPSPLCYEPKEASREKGDKEALEES